MLQKKIIYMDVTLVAILFLMVLVILMLSSCKHEPAVVLMQPLNQLTSANTNNIGHQESTCDPDTSYFQTQVDCWDLLRIIPGFSQCLKAEINWLIAGLIRSEYGYKMVLSIINNEK